MTPEPTKRERQERAILYYLTEFISANGYAPTRHEIARANSISHRQQVQRRLRSLRAQGFIDWEPGLCRTIRVLRGPEGV